MERFFAKILNARISPIFYLLMGLSMVIGFFFATGLTVGASESVLWNSGVLVERQVWGLILLMTSTIAQYGFFTRNQGLISLGGIGGFMAWTFACIGVVMQGHWYVLVTVCILHLLFHVYVVMAAATDNLYRRL